MPRSKLRALMVSAWQLARKGASRRQAARLSCRSLAPRVARTEGEDMGKLGGIRLGSPPSWTTSDGLSTWDLESLMDERAVIADQYGVLAADADERGHDRDWEYYKRLEDEAWRSWRELKNQLADLEGGF